MDHTEQTQKQFLQRNYNFQRQQPFTENKSSSFLRTTLNWKIKDDQGLSDPVHIISETPYQKTNNRGFLRHTINHSSTSDYKIMKQKNLEHYPSYSGFKKYPNDDYTYQEQYQGTGKIFKTPRQQKKNDYLSKYESNTIKKIKSYTENQDYDQTNEESAAKNGNNKNSYTSTSPKYRIKTQGYGVQDQPKDPYNYDKKNNQDMPTRFTKKTTYHDNYYYTPKIEINDNKKQKDKLHINTANKDYLKSHSNMEPNSAAFIKEKYSYIEPNSASINRNKYSPIDTNSHSIKDKYSHMQPSFASSKFQKNSYSSPTNYTNSRVMESRYSLKQKQCRFEDFQLGKCLGQGKFGNVYIATHKETGALFALKKVKKSQIKQHRLENQFMMEIKMQAYFNNRYILKLYGFFDDQDFIYLILEYMEEGTLFLYLKKEKILSEADASRKMREVLTAVEYLHSKSIAHRDIKPQNIVMSNGVCKVCDFGWSALCQDRRKTLVGTIDYAPPEVLKGQEYDGVKIDLWCLGVLCYELLVGKAPFYHVKIKQTMKKIINVDTNQIKIPTTLSVQARDFISKLILKDPQERMTCQQALNHSFILNHIQEDHEYPDSRKKY